MTQSLSWGMDVRSAVYQSDSFESRCKVLKNYEFNQLGSVFHLSSDRSTSDLKTPLHRNLLIDQLICKVIWVVQ